MNFNQVLALVRRIVLREFAWVPRSVDRDDLIGAGLYGVAKATKKYQPSDRVKFITYCRGFVRNEIKHFLRDCAYMIRIPAYLQERGPVEPILVDLCGLPEWEDKPSPLIWLPTA